MEKEIIKQVKFHALIKAMEYANSSPRLDAEEQVNAIREALAPDEFNKLIKAFELTK